MAQNKMIKDENITSTMDCVDEILSEEGSGDSDDKIGDNQESDCKSGILYREQSDRQVVPVVSA
jgi:hypothetical protein